MGWFGQMNTYLHDGASPGVARRLVVVYVDGPHAWRDVGHVGVDAGAAIVYCQARRDDRHAVVAIQPAPINADAIRDHRVPARPHV